MASVIMIMMNITREKRQIITYFKWLFSNIGEPAVIRLGSAASEGTRRSFWSFSVSFALLDKLSSWDSMCVCGISATTILEWDLLLASAPWHSWIAGMYASAGSKVASAISCFSNAWQLWLAFGPTNCEVEESSFPKILHNLLRCGVVTRQKDGFWSTNFNLAIRSLKVGHESGKNNGPMPIVDDNQGMSPVSIENLM